jgi:hypothetical protein
MSLRVGDVIRYSYLWWREHEAGEESGRKVRPCVVVVSIKKQVGDVVRFSVAPVTTAAPHDRAAIELAGGVKKKLKLGTVPSWVICDEVNQFDWPTTDIANVPGGGFTLGMLPPSLLKKVRAKLIEAGIKGALKVADRS